MPTSESPREPMTEYQYVCCHFDIMVSIKSPIALFFRRYHQFNYNPQYSAKDEMNRMCEFFKWKKGGNKDLKVRTLLRQAEVDQAGWLEPKKNDKNDSVLDVLQRAECQILDTSPVPPASINSSITIHIPNGEVWCEYNRMSNFFHWKKGNKKEKNARNLFKRALVDEFGAIYGEKDDRLDDLQLLCRKLEVDPLPQTITDCKEAIQAHYVNIVDFVDCERTGKPIPKFAGLKQLQRHTINEGKIFPKEEAKASLLLRFLLKSIFQ
ncbi:hypothetical protein E4U32_000488 [Claviceps aff. humidiphila group G2b]|nr:hypothetical protein E4U32_000488 [Claviceps aff. humidiphila group G2b]